MKGGRHRRVAGHGHDGDTEVLSCLRLLEAEVPPLGSCRPSVLHHALLTSPCPQHASMTANPRRPPPGAGASFTASPLAAALEPQEQISLPSAK